MKFSLAIKRVGVFAGAAACSVAMACSSGDDEAGTDPAAGGAGGAGGADSGGAPASGGTSGGDIFDTLGVDPPPADTPNFDFSKVDAPYEDVAGCKAFHDDYLDVRQCTCDNCFDLVQQCDALPGCQEMILCGLVNECVDENDCYFGGKCTEVIDRWGNAGSATALFQMIGTCNTDSACPRPTTP